MIERERLQHPWKKKRVVYTPSRRNEKSKGEKDGRKKKKSERSTSLIASGSITFIIPICQRYHF
tara:strand:+ start:369 stop:560 length:192 start_codon:yes stop_codon:yes gene_type:complete